MKKSFVATFLNEENTLPMLLDSILKQSVMPDEVILVDGGSKDKTLKIAHLYSREFRRRRVEYTVIIKKGNRAVGRNEGIRKAKGNIILVTDAGCVPDYDWIKEIIVPFIEENADVAAGYYKGQPENIFQKCLIPYVLVMEDNVNPDTFLPASRSMAFKKKVWEMAGGFPEHLSHNEDYAFAQILRKIKAKIIFRKEAMVYWIPRKNYKEAFIMFFRFSLGDAESGIIRTKVILLCARYMLGLILLTFSCITGSYLLLTILFLIFFVYLIWAISKNYRYVHRIMGFIHLPLLQLTADAAVLAGTLIGVMKFIFRRPHPDPLLKGEGE